MRELRSPARPGRDRAHASPVDVPARGDVVAPPAGADWFASAKDYRGQNGKRLEFVCPADGKPATIYGTDVYTDDSSVCTAAVHDGKITTADGGTVTIEIRPGPELVRLDHAERGHEHELRRSGAAASSVVVARSRAAAARA